MNRVTRFYLLCDLEKAIMNYLSFTGLSLKEMLPLYDRLDDVRLEQQKILIAEIHDSSSSPAAPRRGRKKKK